MTGLRLDKFLFFVRIAKSRTQAQAMIAGGKVRAEGERVINAHATAKVDQVLTLSDHNRMRVIKILALPERRGPAPEAQACYCEIVPSQAIDARLD